MSGSLKLSDLAAFDPEWGIILGSGLGSVVVRAEKIGQIPFCEVPGLPPSGTPGHAGRFVTGLLGGRRVLIAQGRAHLYEGCSPSEVTALVRFMAKVGVKRLVLTNAAGSVNKGFEPGSWMMLTDHINLTGKSPLIGPASTNGSQFVDMTEVYSSALRSHFTRMAAKSGLRLNSGIYAGVIGPQYETPSEVRMLRVMGADAVGMSTVLEAIQARALGMEIAGFSCLANWAAGLGNGPLNHDDVLRNVKVAAEAFSRFLEATLESGM